MTPDLHTARLTLRHPRGEDLDAYAELYADPEAARFITRERHPLSREEAWRLLALVVGHWQLRGYGLWTAVERETGRVVGRIGFFEPEGWPGFELGWALLPSFRGRGYAIEGTRAALAHAFGPMGRDHVVSIIDPDNQRSIRLAERLGERLEGTTQVRGDDVLLYGITREAWARAGVAG